LDPSILSSLSLSTRIVVSILGSLPLSFSSRDDAEEEEDNNKDDENAARRGDAENIRSGAFQSANPKRVHRSTIV
jgi:hypothetical protein